MSPLDPASHAGDLPESDDSAHGPNKSEHGASDVNGHADIHANGSTTNGVLATLDNRLPSVPSAGWSFGPPHRPEILTAKPGPVELLHSVRRRWPLAIGLGTLVGGIAAALVWFFVPVRYEAFALLRVSNKNPSILNKSGAAVEEFAIYKRTQVDLIRSSLVLIAVTRDVKINRLATLQEHSDDQLVWLSNQLIIDYPNDAEVLRVAMKGTRPADLKLIVNKVVESYLKEIVQRDRDVRRKNQADLEESYKRQKADLSKEWADLNKLERLENVSTSDAVQIRRRIATDELTEAMSRRSRLGAQIAENERSTMLAQAKQDKPENARPPDALVEAELEKNQSILQLGQQLAYLEAQLSGEESKSANRQAPAVKRLRDSIQKMNDTLDDKKAELRPKIIELLSSGTLPGAGLSGSMTLPMLAQDRAYLDKQHDEAMQDVEVKAKALGDLEKFSTLVSSKKQDVESLVRITNEIRVELDRIRVEDLATDRVTSLDEATTPSGNGDAVRKYVGVVFAAILGFGLVVLGVAFGEFQSRRLNSVPQVNDGLGIRVVGELPNVSGRTWKRLKGGKGASVLQALMAERIDGTRTALIHAASIDPPRVVMITSAEPREGKTTTATQLAASLARSGRRTLLIDADIRNPGVHRVFDMPHEPGLCELLRGEAERDTVIQPTRTANLWLLPAGRCDLRSVQALSSSYLGTAIAALCVQFEYIVIDSGPVLKVADPLLVGQHVDGAIVSTLRDVSRVPKVYEATERLRSVGITVLGAVVNGVSDDAARHGVELLMAETT